MSGNIHKVAKNAATLYLRAAVSLLIQLAAVRYLLKYLGEESYGLYGLIGSIVFIAESLRSIFTASLQRFYNIESGSGNTLKLRDIFNVGHRLITLISLTAVVIIIVGGLIAIPYLNIPTKLQNAGRIVLILSAITLGSNLLNTVYDAVLIANEKFNYIASISIGQSVLKLVSVLALVYFPTERVEWYSLFILIVSLSALFCSSLLCRRHYKKIVSIAMISDKSLYKEIGLFAVYKGLGSIATSIQSGGINVLLNIFGGLVVNTARTISYQVISAVNILVWNLVTGFSPRCISLYGEGNYTEFYKMLYLMIKSSLTINVTLGFLISAFISPILRIWLGEIPPYAPSFIRIIFLFYIVRAIQDGLDLLFTTIGRIKEFQYIISITQIISIIIGWFFLWLGFPYYSVFVVMTFMECLCILLGLYYSQKLCEFNVAYFFRTILIPLAILLIILSTVLAFTHTYISEMSNLFFVIMLGILYLIISALLSIYILFGKDMTGHLLKIAISHLRIKANM